MRLRLRRNVDLPQPDGPISAVITLRWICDAHAREGLLGAVVDVHVVGVEDARPARIRDSDAADAARRGARLDARLAAGRLPMGSSKSSGSACDLLRARTTRAAMFAIRMNVSSTSAAPQPRDEARGIGVLRER